MRWNRITLGLALAAAAPFALAAPEYVNGLARDGSYLLLAGTDNDYSVTQNASSVQFDVYFRLGDANPFDTSIQCPLDSTSDCFWTADGTDATVPADGSYRLLPGVLVAWKVPAGELPGFVPAVPPAAQP